MRSFHVENADKTTVNNIVRKNIACEIRIHTDEIRLYWDVKQTFLTHETVNHSAGEYVRGDVYTKAAEGFCSLFKRGMKGIYQHCSESTFTAIWPSTVSATIIALPSAAATLLAPKRLKGVVGKRLTYQTASAR